MTAPASSTSGHGLLYPLNLFRQRDSHPLPAIEPLDGGAVPEPYRSLLVHTGDMTSRLEAFHHSSMTLRALHVEAQATMYWREVLLCTQDASLPVEYGAIEIRLEAFPEPLRAEIVTAKKPLGGLLNQNGMKYHSEPRGFFRVLPDLTLARLFEVDAGACFYGRSNRLVGPEGETLARIVEVLRP
jgi:chorismate-pyruvate lyase